MSNPDQNHSLNASQLVLVEDIRDHFDTAYYLTNNRDILDAGVDPLVHYALYGWREGRDPNDSFSTRFYIDNNPDVAAADLHPFQHYINVGRAEGRPARRPEPSLGAERESERERIAALAVLKPVFDVDFYLAQNPDVAAAGVDPLLHYFLFGWKENRDPTPEFSTVGYLQINPDVAAAGVNPFWHYHVQGKLEGRVWVAAQESSETAPEASAESEARRDRARIDNEIAAIRDAFDTAYYLRHNPDVAEAGLDPIDHFVVAGWREGRDPSLSFSVSYYLDGNPDVRELGINPFWHYVVAGEAEGRLPRHPGGDRVARLIKTRTLEETVRAWSGKAAPDAVLTVAQLCSLIRGAASVGTSMLMLSFGHDNYREISGGVQFCIQKEEELASDRGVLYLNLHPYQPLPRLAHDRETADVLVSLLLAGKLIGTAPMSVVTDAVRALVGDFDAIETVIHHLLGHSPEQVADVVRATGQERCRLWLHDFFTLCPSFALQRNNVSYCAGPPMNSNACRLCLYGEERVVHQARIAHFFEEIAVHVIAPSRFTADFWEHRANLQPASLTVCEHVTIDWRARKTARPRSDVRITFAFVGYPAPHKGWHVFENVVRLHRGAGSKFRFLYFGTSRVALDEVESIHVHVTADDPDAMIRALRENDVDIVLHWASWGETFSFSTYEALAAGACVLTNPNSGNVAVAVKEQGAGAVLQGEAELEAFLTSARVDDMVKKARSRRESCDAVLTRSDLTFSVLDSERQP